MESVHRHCNFMSELIGMPFLLDINHWTKPPTYPHHIYLFLSSRCVSCPSIAIVVVCGTIGITVVIAAYIILNQLSFNTFHIGKTHHHCWSNDRYYYWLGFRLSMECNRGCSNGSLGCWSRNRSHRNPCRLIRPETLWTK